MSNKVEIVNPLAFEYAQLAAPIINTLCEPLFSTFGLTTFIYVRIFYNGKYLLLSNQTNWVQHWLQNLQTIKNTAFHMELQNVPEKKPFYFLWDTAPQDKLIQMHNQFGIWHGFDIDFRLEDSIEVWSFGTSSDKEQIDNFYLNNFQLFHRFCLYFREKAASLFEIKNETQLGSFKEVSDFSFHSSLSKKEEVSDLFFTLFPDSYSLQTKNGLIKLSKREIECAFYLAQGKTSKEIAQILQISPRTVESYIATTKHKTGHYSKSELGDLVRNTPLKWL